MRTYHLVGLLSALCIFCFTFQACSSDSDDDIQVGVCLKNPSNNWRKALKTHAVNSLKGYQLTYKAEDAENESKQSQLIRKMIKKECEVLIVSPEGEPKQALNEAVSAGIPVILSEAAPIDNYSVLIQIDNTEIGKSAAIFFNQQPVISKIALFSINQDVAASTGRINGIKEHLNSELQYLIITLDNYTFEEGAAATRQLLQEHPDVDAIYAQDDGIALGVLSALESSAQVKAVAGCGGSEEFFNKIKESTGISLATTLYSPKALMEAAVKEANTIIKEANAPEKKLVKLGSELVTQENVEEHLANPPY